MSFLKNKKLWLIVGAIIAAAGGAWSAGLGPEQIFDAVLAAIQSAG